MSESKMSESKKVWFVKFPTYQYNEDLTELARENNLRVLDARFNNGKGVKGPALTLKSGEKVQAGDTELELTKVSGIGKGVAKKLADIDIVSLEDLASAESGDLVKQEWIDQAIELI